MMRNKNNRRLLNEGVAQFGSKILMMRIVKEIKSGNCTYRINNKGNSLRRIGKSSSTEIQWFVKPDSWAKIWDEAQGSFRDWMVKKFYNKEFFVENWSAITFALVSSYKDKDAVGLASPTMANIRVKPKGSITSKYKWRVASSNPILQQDLKNQGDTNYISIKANSTFINQMHKKLDWYAIGTQLENDLTAAKGYIESNVWVHELQHWIQFLHYYGDDRAKQSEPTEVKPKDWKELTDIRWQEKTGVSPDNWESMVEEYDAETSVWLSVVAMKLVEEKEYVRILLNLLYGNTQAAFDAIKIKIKEMVVARQFVQKLIDSQEENLNSTIKRFVDFLQECVEASSPENYISPQDLKKWVKLDDKEFLKKIYDTGWLSELQEKIYSGNPN